MAVAPGNVLARLNVGDAPIVISPTSAIWNAGNQLGGYAVVILCVDIWGAGGTGGSGSFVGKDGFIGGGGAAGNFTRMYVQTQKQALAGGVTFTDLTMTIAAGSITIVQNQQAGNFSASLTALAGAAGGNWVPALGTAQAAAGAASVATAASRFVQSPAGSSVIYSPGTVLNTFPYDLPVAILTTCASATIINTTDLPIQYLSGAAGASGWQGGAGGAPTEAGGARAGWGGVGAARSRTDLPSAPGPAMTIVYVVAAQ